MKKEILLDILFYLLFIPIFWAWSRLFIAAASMMPDLSKPEALTSSGGNLLAVLFGMIGSFLVLILLVIANIAVFKSMIWQLSLKQKADIKIVPKAAFMNIIYLLIFIVPSILSFIPFLRDAEAYMNTGIVRNNPVNLMWPCIIFMVFSYFLSISYLYLAKDKKLFLALKHSLRDGIFRFGQLWQPYFFLFVSIISLIGLSRLNSYFLWIIPAALIMISAWGRNYVTNILVTK